MVPVRGAVPAISRRLTRTVLAVFALAAPALAAGCGSSGASGTDSGSTSPSGATTTASTSTAHTTTQAGLQPQTTPKFASPSPSAPIQSGVVPIAYRNIAIAPDTVRVKVGSTVKWTNYDSVRCNVTSEGGPMKFASGSFGEGGTYELKITKPGTIHYECTLFPATMNGTIEVVKG
jgi:plastocyanin